MFTEFTSSSLALISTVDISRFTHLTALELEFKDKTFMEQLALLEKTCTSVSSPFIEKLHVYVSWWRYKPSIKISQVYAALADLRAMDTLLSRSQFSRLSDVTFKYGLSVWLEEEPTTFGCLMAPLSNNANVGATTSLRPLRDDPLPNDAYVLDEEDGTLRLSSSYLANFLQQWVDGELRRLQHRGILTNKVLYVNISRPIDKIRSDAFVTSVVEAMVAEGEAEEDET